MSKHVYRQVLIVAIIAFIPIVLATGIVSGYLVGIVLEEHFHLPWIIFLGCVLMGVLGSIVEVVRLIKLAIRTENEKQNERRNGSFPAGTP